MLGVNLNDYASGNIDSGALFDSAATTPESLAELSKALEAGAITGNSAAGLSTPGLGAPLKVESLDRTLKHLEYRESDIVFWKLINKSPAYNTVEEFNQLVSYGSDRGGFTAEGELPEEEDSTYRRVQEQVKFLGVTKSVSHPMQLVRLQPGIGQIMQREVKNGTMWILRKANRSLAFGDALIVPQEYNGFYAQQRNSFSTLIQYHDSDQVIDLRGSHMKEVFIEDGALSIINNNGYPDCLIAPPVVLSDFAKEFLSKKLIHPNTQQVTAGVMGQKVTSVQTTYGLIKLKYDKFLASKGARKLADGAQSAKAPTAPTAGVAPVTAADGLSKFDAATAGDYFYAVAAINRYGESALTHLTGAGAVSVATGERVDLAFSDAGGAYPATGYMIYVSKKDPATAAADTFFYPIFAVATAEKVSGYDGAAAGLVGDRNRYLPDTQQAWMFENTDEVLEFKQLAPLMRMDLAVLAPATRFMILLYGTPQLFAPKKAVRFVNIGRYA